MKRGIYLDAAGVTKLNYLAPWPVLSGLAAGRLDQQQQQHAALLRQGVLDELNELLIRMMLQVLHIHSVEHQVST